MHPCWEKKDSILFRRNMAQILPLRFPIRRTKSRCFFPKKAFRKDSQEGVFRLLSRDMFLHFPTQLLFPCLESPASYIQNYFFYRQKFSVLDFLPLHSTELCQL